MVLQLDSRSEAEKQRAHEKLLLQMQLNARGNQDAANFLRGKQADVANVTYMRQEAARRAQAERMARQRDMYADQREHGQQIGLQNNAAVIASNAAIQAGSTARRHAELVDKLQRGQLDDAQKRELEQLTIKQIQELEQMRVQNQLGQGDMRLQDELLRGQNEQRQGHSLEGKAADYGYGALEAAQQQQYGMQGKEADFGYKTREQAQRDAQAAAMAEFQARQLMEQAKQQHGYSQENLRLGDELQRGQIQQQHGNTMESQGQQNDFYLGRDSLKLLQDEAAQMASQLSQLKLSRHDEIERDKLLNERRLILEQTPSGGRTGAKQTAERLSKWAEKAASANLGARAVREPTIQELYGKQTFVDPDTGQRMQSDGKGGFSPVFPVGKTPEPVDPDAPMKEFLDAYMKQSKVFKGQDSDQIDIYEPPNYQDALKAWDERQRLLEQRRNPQAKAQPRELPDVGYEQGGRWGMQEVDMLPGGLPQNGGGVVQYAPRDGSYPPAQNDSRQQAATITPEIVQFVQAHAEKSRGMGLEFGEYLTTLDPQSRAMLERAYQLVTQR